MSNIKNYKNWLLEKKEIETKDSYKIEEPKEKEFSKELASNNNYNHIKDKTVANKETSTSVKPSKKGAKATFPTKDVKINKADDVQTNNKKIKDAEPSKKGTYETEKEEAKKISSTKKQSVSKSPIPKGKISKKIK